MQQPWAWAIFHGKDVENRTQLWKYRGPVAIHAGARWSDRGAHDLNVTRACARSWPIPPTGDRLDYVAASIARHGLEPSLYPATLALTGAVLGVVDLVGVHYSDGCCSPWGEDTRVQTDRLIVHLELENARAFETPIPGVKGKLGLWTPDADLLDAIQTAA